MDCRIYFILQRKPIWRLRHMDKRRKRSPVLTVAGPMIVTPFLSAVLISLRVRASGMPSAIMAMVRICMKIKQTISTPQCCPSNKCCRAGKGNSCSEAWSAWSGLQEVVLCPHAGRPSTWIQSTVIFTAVSMHCSENYFFSRPCTLEQHRILTNPKVVTPNTEVLSPSYKNCKSGIRICYAIPVSSLESVRS